MVLGLLVEGFGFGAGVGQGSTARPRQSMVSAFKLQVSVHHVLCSQGRISSSRQALNRLPTELACLLADVDLVASPRRAFMYENRDSGERWALNGNGNASAGSHAFLFCFAVVAFSGALGRSLRRDDYGDSPRMTQARQLVSSL